MIDCPDYLDDYSFIASAYKAKYFLEAPPVGLIAHCGTRRRGVANYLAGFDPGDRAEVDARQVNCQFAWYVPCSEGPGITEGFVQMVPLRMKANHAGRPWNGLTWGFEIPGPWDEIPRSPAVKSAAITLVKRLIALPGTAFKWITGHQFVCDDRKDPGPGVSGSWWDGLGLDVRWSRWRWRGK